MSTFRRIVSKRSTAAMTLGLGLVAAFAAAPALADSPQEGSSASAAAARAATPVTRTKQVGTRLGVIVIHGVVDPDKQRWTDSGKANPVLPTVSESAFLEDEGGESVEFPADTRP